MFALKTSNQGVYTVLRWSQQLAEKKLKKSELSDSTWTYYSDNEDFFVFFFVPFPGPVLNELSTGKIESAEDRGEQGGNQLKFFIKLEEGQMAIFKPQW